MILIGRMRAGEHIPFGPYLAGAGMIALLYGARLTRLCRDLLQP